MFMSASTAGLKRTRGGGTSSTEIIPTPGGKGKCSINVSRRPSVQGWSVPSILNVYQLKVLGQQGVITHPRGCCSSPSPRW
jgi:hypothetical protein